MRLLQPSALLGLILYALCLGWTVHARAASLTIAAAADLQYVLAEVVQAYRAHRPGSRIEVIYGSSGKFYTQIKNGAPFDLYFSADIEYPKRLEAQGFAAGPTQRYAIGRIVL